MNFAATATRAADGITPELVAEHGLSLGEYKLLVAALGGEPKLTELGIFSVMWSEHCSYKSSKVWLKKLPTEGPQVIQGPGENAGVVDIGVKSGTTNPGGELSFMGGSYNWCSPRASMAAAAATSTTTQPANT